MLDEQLYTITITARWLSRAEAQRWIDRLASEYLDGDEEINIVPVKEPTKNPYREQVNYLDTRPYADKVPEQIRARWVQDTEVWDEGYRAARTFAWSDGYAAGREDAEKTSDD